MRWPTPATGSSGACRMGRGAGNTYLRPFDDDRIIVNMSVWESIEQLRAYTYGGAHAEILRQRREWFEKFERVSLALWWIPAGHIPTVDDAKQRLASLDDRGPTPYAFTFTSVFPPDAIVERPLWRSSGKPGCARY
jgi:Domain of unknown function (DUF3291)